MQQGDAAVITVYADADFRLRANPSDYSGTLIIERRTWDGWEPVQGVYGITLETGVDMFPQLTIKRHGVPKARRT